MQQGFNIWLPSSMGKVAGALEPGFLLSKTELKWGLRGENQGIGWKARCPEPGEPSTVSRLLGPRRVLSARPRLEPLSLDEKEAQCDAELTGLEGS